MLTINIIGNGSMGHLWASHLLQQENNIRLFGRKSKAKQTYRLQKPEQNFHYQLPVLNLSDWRDADWTIICVKAGALDPLCEQLSNLRILSTSILLMMNGLGLTRIVTKALPNCPVYHASTSHGAYLSNGLLKHTGIGRTLIGELRQTEPLITVDPTVTSLIKVLNAALPETCLDCNHKQTRWKKLFVNAVINPLTAFYKVDNSAINNDPMIQQHAIRLTKELKPMINHYLPNESWQSIWEETSSIARQTAKNRSSMRQDVEANKVSEIAFITGYLLKKAKGKDIDLTEHQRIFEQIRAMQHTIE